MLMRSHTPGEVGINSSLKRRVSMTALSAFDPPNLPSNFSPSRHER